MRAYFRSLFSILVLFIVFLWIYPSSALNSQIHQRFEFPVQGNSSTCYFTPNLGQWDDRVLFRTSIGDAVIFFGRSGLTIFLTEKPKNPYSLESPGQPFVEFNGVFPRLKSVMVEVKFIGANPDAQVEGECPLPFYHNYFLGSDPRKWRTHVPNYSSIMYRDIYPGIDIAYRGENSGLKYDIIVNPGADLSQVTVAYLGIKELRLSGADLEIKTTLGTLTERVPAISLVDHEKLVPLAGGYRLLDTGMVGFRLEVEYNKECSLVIDPELLFSTFLGGSEHEIAHGISIDSEGYCIVSGGTWSSDYPTLNPYDSTYDGYGDIFISKFTPQGDSLVFSTFIGSPGGNEIIKSIALDINNYIYGCGHTNSPNFPVVNPFDDDYDLNQDAVVLKMSPGGDSLLFSTYLGGGGSDGAADIEVDAQGSAYVVGTTISITFPVVNPYDGQLDGYDAFLTKFAPAGNSLIYSTFLGGTGPLDRGIAVAVDAENCAYVSGLTESTDFPVYNAFDSTFNGGQGDAFLTKFVPGGDSLIYSTFLGGSGDDVATANTIDAEGRAHLIGETNSVDFPTANAFQGNLEGVCDVFITKFTPSGDSLEFSTYFGGSANDQGRDIGLDSFGNVYMAFMTGSDDIPLADAFDSLYGGGYTDGAFACLGAGGDTLIYGTYLGGNSEDSALRLAVGDSGLTLVTGWTYSEDFPVVNAFQAQRNGWADVFLTGFLFTPYGCPYIPGDINNSSEANGIDVIYGVNYFKGGQVPPIDCGMPVGPCPQESPFYAAGDVNGNCAFNGIDITYFVSYLKGGPALLYCPDCPPID